MICIKCFSKSTSIINSRPHKRSPSTWRRRKCVTCGYTFTTSEFIALEDSILISDTPFSVHRLALSITSVLTSDDAPAETAYWIARTIGEQLLAKETAITLEMLLKTTHEALTRYNPTAGLQYALRYHLVETTTRPKRGRPSFKRHHL